MNARIAFPLIFLSGLLAACASFEPAEFAGRTFESWGRSLCDEAGNCRNTCSDGSTTAGPLYQCPSRIRAN